MSFPVILPRPLAVILPGTDDIGTRGAALYAVEGISGSVGLVVDRYGRMSWVPLDRIRVVDDDAQRVAATAEELELRSQATP